MAAIVVAFAASAYADRLRGKPLLSGTVSTACPALINCPPAKAERIIIDDQTGHQVAQLKTDAAGRFQIRLQPGDYQLHPGNQEGRARMVTVRPGSINWINVTLD